MLSFAENCVVTQIGSLPGGGGSPPSPRSACPSVDGQSRGHVLRHWRVIVAVSGSTGAASTLVGVGVAVKNRPAEGVGEWGVAGTNRTGLADGLSPHAADGDTGTGVVFSARHQPVMARSL